MLSCCHPTVSSMIFNVDRSQTFTEREKKKTRKTKKRKGNLCTVEYFVKKTNVLHDGLSATRVSAICISLFCWGWFYFYLVDRSLVVWSLVRATFRAVDPWSRVYPFSYFFVRLLRPKNIALILRLPSDHVQHDLQRWSLINIPQQKKIKGFKDNKGNLCTKSAATPFCTYFRLNPHYPLQLLILHVQHELQRWSLINILRTKKKTKGCWFF